jgi:DNA polymerase IIIc chi subunit
LNTEYFTKTGFFNKRHARTGLGHVLAARVFPNAPRSERALDKLDRRWQSVRKLRNRVFHHERLLHWTTLDQQHAELLEVIKWIAPELEEATTALDRFRQIRSDGLTPWIEKIQTHWPQR